MGIQSSSALAARFHALELSNDAAWTVVQRQAVEVGGREFETGRTIEFAVDAEYRLGAEEVRGPRPSTGSCLIRSAQGL